MLKTKFNKNRFTSQMISDKVLREATEKVARIKMEEEEEKALLSLQSLLEEWGEALKNKGVKILRGQNYKLQITYD